MSDLKQTTEVETEIANEVETEVDNEVETEVEDDFSDLTEDDYFKLQERLKKAESTIVKYKKWAKAKKSEEPSNTDAVTRADLELMKFVAKNPEYEWAEDEIKSYLSKWLTINQAKKLVEVDETVKNRAKTKSSSITAWEVWWTKTQYSVDELEKMSQTEYNRVRDLIDEWKAVIK